MDKDVIENKLDELTDVVIFIKDHMATKEELTKVEDRLGVRITKVEDRLSAVEGKLDGIVTRMDYELDKRKVMEVQIGTLNKKVLGAS